MNIEVFGDYGLDEHPLSVLGVYDHARRVFGGEESLGRLIAGFNATVFGRTGDADDPRGGQADAQ